MLARARAVEAFQHFASLGFAPDDSDGIRAQKAALSLSAGCITALAVGCVGTYGALGFLMAAAIPLAYHVVSVASIAILARTKDYGFVRFTQATYLLVGRVEKVGSPA
jgi:hypothetical protein